MPTMHTVLQFGRDRPKRGIRAPKMADVRTCFWCIAAKLLWHGRRLSAAAYGRSSGFRGGPSGLRPSSPLGDGPTPSPHGRPHIGANGVS